MRHYGVGLAPSNHDNRRQHAKADGQDAEFAFHVEDALRAISRSRRLGRIQLLEEPCLRDFPVAHHGLR
jgi:hypothetical protein